MRPITVHDARHTCATLLVELDVHPGMIMRILRHADQAVTMEIYANANSSTTREAFRVVASQYLSCLELTFTSVGIIGIDSNFCCIQGKRSVYRYSRTITGSQLSGCV